MLVIRSRRSSKVISDTVLLFYFISLKEGNFECRKNGFYFTSKGLFVFWIFKCYKFRILNFLTSSNAKAWNKKYVLLYNFGSTQSLEMKFGRFMSRNTFYCITWSKLSLEMKYGRFMSYCERNMLSKKVLEKMWPGN